MWLVHAGNRVDEPGRTPARFPADNVDVVGGRLHALLATLRPDGVVSAAAAGADLLLLEAALDLGIHFEVVLPLPVEQFVERSIADQGHTWIERLDRVLPDRSAARVVDLSDHDEWYLAGNDVILDGAFELAGHDDVLALVVRPRPTPGQESVTDDFATKAGRRTAVIDIDPVVDDRPSALLLVPSDAAGDSIFRKLLVPLAEDADLAWTRLDPSGVDARDAAAAIDRAEVVVADLTDPAPVLSDASVRDALASRPCVFTERDDGAPPEGSGFHEVLRYHAARTAISDREALTAIAAHRDAFGSTVSAARRSAGDPGDDGGDEIAQRGDR